MVTREQFRSAGNRAIKNVIRHGDTDIFPFTFESPSFFDKQSQILELIVEYDENFDTYLARYPPNHVSSLTPVTYSGFRWATQLDPIWNLYFLTCVLSIADLIELQRMPIQDKSVFSYRYNYDDKTGDLFDRTIGWHEFIRTSEEYSLNNNFVVVCDISEFYPRLGHHRLENALKHVAGGTQYPKNIMAFLSNFTNTNSFGLPVGGPAARLLSELTINQIDRLLHVDGVTFARFADDYHLFARTRDEAYRILIYLSDKLYLNQGLTLQKSKTRIMSSAEFRATSPLAGRDLVAPEEEGEAVAASHKANQLLQFSLRFDPYSPSAQEDYEHLKEEVRRFDIVLLLKEELLKSRVHLALARKIVSAVRYLDDNSKNDAILSIVDNCDLLYPILSSVLLTLSQVFAELFEKTKIETASKLSKLIREDSHVFRVDIHLAYAIRVLSHLPSPDNELLLHRTYMQRESPLIRRDIII